jgi:GNAT superfamily N-acetyltransferase
VIRPARPDEAETLLRVQRDACLVALAHIFPPERYAFPNEDVLAAWREALADDGAQVYVAEVDGEVVGCVSLAHGFLSTLYVIPSEQGTGIGTALHDLALERLRAHGHRVARLWTLEENWDARRYYEKRGWILTEATRVVPFPPKPTDVQYAKTL